ncbi:MAG TPA: hypothetical protein VEM32_04725, partial [Geobacteraceae bacterium]|nr:hypothetical protein [Geobacteraceae bacterium]
MKYYSLPIDQPFTHTLHRPRVQGKFLYVGGEKLFICGTAYGAFPPNSTGHQFPEPSQVESDFALMRQAGI